MIHKLQHPNFVTQSGRSFQAFNLYYQTFGRPLGEAPTVLILHSLTGDAQVCGVGGWWNDVVGPSRAIDIERYSILAFNIPGNGVEHDLLEDPTAFHLGDIANLMLWGLSELKIDHVYGIVGGSIGGGLVWELAAKSPTLAQHWIPIAADWKATDWLVAHTYLQKNILENSSDPLFVARINAMITYRHPKSFKSRFKRSFNAEKQKFNIESWLDHHGDKIKERFLLEAYKSMNHLLSTLDIGRDGKSFEDCVAQIEGAFHLVAIDTDLFFFPEEDQDTTAELKRLGISAHYHEIQSDHGHDAFLIESQQVHQILAPIFKPKAL